jgi:hypothetical protein
VHAQYVGETTEVLHRKLKEFGKQKQVLAKITVISNHCLHHSKLPKERQM